MFSSMCSHTVITLLLYVMLASSSLSQVYFVILSQSHPHHKSIEEETRQMLKDCLKQNHVEQNQILVLHETPVKGGRTFFPLLPIIIKSASAGITFTKIHKNTFKLSQSLLMCISTSFQVLCAPESWSKYFLF